MSGNLAACTYSNIVITCLFIDFWFFDAAAEKQPKKHPCCPNPICIGHRKELVSLKKNMGLLKQSTKKTLKLQVV